MANPWEEDWSKQKNPWELNWTPTVPETKGPVPQSGGIAAFKGTIEGMKGDAALTAGKLGLMSLQEAEEYKKAQTAKQQQIYAPTQDSWGTSPFTKGAELFMGSLPYLAAPIIGAGAGAAGAALLAPAAAAGTAVAAGSGVLGALGLTTAAGVGALGANALQYTGSNLGAQMEDGRKLADTNLLTAGATAIGQAALDNFSLGAFPVVQKIFGKEGIKISEDVAKEIVKKGTLATAGEYIAVGAKVAGKEGTTEVGQEFLQRLQAGQSLTDEKAREAYYENFIGGAVLGGAFGVVGHKFDKMFPKKEGEQVEEKPQPKPSQMLMLPAPEQQYFDDKKFDPLQNPLGNFLTGELTPEQIAYIDKDRKDNNKPVLSSYSLEDFVDALRHSTDSDEAKQGALDSMLTFKTGFDGSVKQTPETILEIAKNKNIETGTAGFNDFLTRVTGTDNLEVMSPVQIHSAVEALSRLPDYKTLQILPEGTNATRFSEKQYETALKNLKDVYSYYDTDVLGQTSVVKEIMDFTGLTDATDAKALLRYAINKGDLEENFSTAKVDGQNKKVVNISFAGKVKPLPSGFDIRHQTFKQGEEPEYYDIVNSEGKPVDKAYSKEEADALAQQYQEKTHKELAPAIEKRIEKATKAIENMKQRLYEHKAKGFFGTPAHNTLAAELGKRIRQAEQVISDSQKELANLNAPVRIVPRGTKAVVGKKHVFYDENGKATASFHEKEHAEQYGLMRKLADGSYAVSDAMLQQIIDTAPETKGTLPKRYAAMAKKELERRSGNAKKGIEVQTDRPFNETFDLMREKLLPELKKLGLEKVGLRIVDSIANGTADGSYVKEIIRIAYDAKNQLGTLRHEAIHALKELGAFTPQEWKILENKAKSEWIDRFIKSRSTGKQSLYEAYQDAFKQANNGSLKGFDEYIQEEAIAEAFKFYAHKKAPAGLIGDLFYRFKNLLEAVQNVFKQLGYTTADEIFTALDAGKRAPVGAAKTSGNTRYSFVRDRVAGEKEISTQNASGVKAKYNPLEQMLSIDEKAMLEAMEDNPEFKTRTIEAIKGYGFMPKDIADEDVFRVFKENIISNLKYLYDQVPKEIRERSKLWYDGAEKIATQMAKVYNITPNQVAGILAAMSPQKDWFQNVSMAERAIHILTNQGNRAWDDNMLQYAKSYVNEAENRADKEKRQKEFEHIESVAKAGKVLNKMTDAEAAAFVRAYDEAYQSRDYRIVTPEGGFGGLVMKKPNKQGEIYPATMTWSGYNPIKKSVSIFRNGAEENINHQLGFEHKIRSFYNNIIAPNSNIEHVTMDTHAVAAGQFEALAGSDKPVSDNFGGTGKNKNIGVGGTYGLIADAYRDLAKSLGIKARELQSITWEAVRGLFDEDNKSSMKEPVRAEWDKYRDGKQTFEQARDNIVKIAGGIDNPQWLGTDAGQEIKNGGSSYDKSFVPEGGVRLREENEVRERIKVNLSNVTSSIPGLNELYKRALKGNKKAYDVLQATAESHLRHLLSDSGAKVIFEKALGAYNKEREPSLNVTISFPESDRAKVMAPIARFATNFNQQQVHVRQPTYYDVGHNFGDGSYVTPVFTIATKNELTNDDIQNIIDKTGISGLNVVNNPKDNNSIITAYWVNEKEDLNAKSESEINEFSDKIKSIQQLVGRSGEKAGRKNERIFVYGTGDGARLRYDTIDGDIRTKEETDTKTAGLIASYFKDEPVVPFKQKKLTNAVVSLQKSLAAIFDALPTNGLKFPLTRRAYNALAKELIEQYKVLPIKANVVTRVMINGLPFDYFKNTKPLKDYLTNGMLEKDANEAIEYLKNNYGMPNPEWKTGLLSKITADNLDIYKNSAEMRRDVGENNTLKVYKTSPQTFGTNKSNFKSHPLLKDSGLKDVNGYPMLYNDILRVVHDYYAHNMEKIDFGDKGEFAAAMNHLAVTIDPLAKWALIAETRLQNAWQNFREGLDTSLSYLDRGFATQKAALPPLQYALTGDANVDKAIYELAKTLTPEERLGNLPSSSPLAKGENKVFEGLAKGEKLSIRDDSYGIPKTLWQLFDANTYHTGVANEDISRIITPGAAKRNQTMAFKRLEKEAVKEYGDKALAMLSKMSQIRGIQQAIAEDDEGMLNTYQVSAPDVYKEVMANQPQEKFSIRAPETEEFKRWFKGSKITDANGKPLVVYHATTAEFNSFDKKYAELGFHFGATPEQSNDIIKDYSNEKDEDKYLLNSRIIPVFLNIKKPFETQEDIGIWDNVNLWKSYLKNWELGDDGVLNLTEKQINNLKTSDDIITLLKNKGYDGIEYPNHHEAVNDDAYLTGDFSKAYIVFEPNQIKSAFNQNPTESNDIRYSIRAPETEEFKRWFKGSQVVDEEGNPLLVYRGQRRDAGAKSTDLGLRATPSFTDNKYVASVYSYAKSKGQYTEGSHIAPSYLKMVSPIDLREFGNEPKPLIDLLEVSGITDLGESPDVAYNILKDLADIQDNTGFESSSFTGNFEYVGEAFDELHNAFEKDLDIETLGTLAFDILEDLRVDAFALPDSPVVVEYVKEYNPRADGFIVRDAISFSGMQLMGKENLKSLGGDSGYDAYRPFEQKQIKSAFNQNPTESEDVRYSIRDLGIDPQIKTRINANTFKRVEKGFVERLMDAISPDSLAKIRQAFLNKYEGIERLSKEIGRQFGSDQLLADTSAIAAALQSDRASGIAASAFRDGVPVFDKGYTYVSDLGGKVKGLIPVLEPLMKYNNPEIFQAFQYYAGTRRGKRLLADGREQLFTQDDIKYGNELEKQFPEFKGVFEEYQKFNQGLVKYMKDTGVISDVEATLWTQNWDYIPFYRQLDGETTAGPRVFSALSGVAKPKKLKGGEEQLADFLETVVRNSRAAIESGMKNEAARRVVRDAVRIGLAQDVPLGTTGSDIVTVKENGLTKYYRVADPLLVESMKGLNLPQMEFLSWLSAPANLLRNLVTKDPGFMLANLGRDSLQAWITSGTDMMPIVDTFKQFGKTLTNQSPEAAALARAGLTGYDFAGDVASTAKMVEKELRKRGGNRTTTEKALLPITAFWDALEHGSNASDMATRAEVYKKTLERTGNEAEAFYQAMEVLNFSRKGNNSVIRILTAVVPFFNARVQGLDVLYRSGWGKMATENAEVQKKAFAVRALTMMGLSMAYWFMVSDDDEYKRLNKEERDNNWIVPAVTVNGKPFKFPIPFELGVVFKVLPERVLETAFGNDTSKDLKEALVRNMVSTLQFNPIPQAFVPIVENVANYSFFTGEPIVGQGMQDVAAKYQYNQGTTSLAKSIGEATNQSPIKIDNLIRGYTGTMGTYAVQVLDAIFETQGDSVRASKRLEQMPVIKRFFASDSGTISAYYGLKEEVDTVVRTINVLEKSGDPTALKEYIEENKGLYQLKTYVSSIDKQMKKLREYKNYINTSKTMDADEKRDRLNAIHEMEINMTSKVKDLRKAMI